MELNKQFCAAGTMMLWKIENNCLQSMIPQRKETMACL